MQKVNYGRMFDELAAELEKRGERPSLLLHACCAPCSSHTLTVLAERFRVTLYFCNPNIAPESEFEYRSRELKRQNGIFRIHTVADSGTCLISCLYSAL